MATRRAEEAPKLAPNGATTRARITDADHGADLYQTRVRHEQQLRRQVAWINELAAGFKVSELATTACVLSELIGITETNMRGQLKRVFGLAMLF